MSVSLKVALAQARHQRGRLALAGLAIVAASCVVVWVVSGYDALTAKFDEFADDALGRYDLVLVPGSRRDPFVSDALVERLRADPDVLEVAPVVQVAPTRDLAVSITRDGPRASEPDGEAGGRRGSGRRGPGGPPSASPPAHVAPVPSGALGQRVVETVFYMPDLVGTDAAAPPYELVQGRWFDPAAPERLEVVLDRQGARAVRGGVGDTLTISSGTGELRVTVVGVVEGAELETSLGRGGGPAVNALYLPRATLERVAGHPAPRTNLVQVDLRQGVDLVAFRARVEPLVSGAQPPVVMAALNDVVEGLERGSAARGARGQAYSATAMALLAALFIIFTTSSMGVSERLRQLALLRAVGLSRAQVAGTVLAEALGLAVMGWLGGLVAGWLLLQAVQQAQPDLFPRGASLGAWCVGLSAVVAFGGALAAAVIPAVRAARVDPLEAMSARAASTPRGWLHAAAPVGAVLVAAGPFVLTVAPVSDETRPLAFALVGVPAMAVGLLLLAPAVVIEAERVLGPLVARLLGLEPRLLSAQLSSNLARTVGTTLALSVGLGLFVSIQVWGYSMLHPFLPGAWAPDAFVAFMSGGLPDEELPAVAATPGVTPGRCAPLAVEQARLVEDLLGAEQGGGMTRQDNVLMCGLDPSALTGDDPLFDLEFVAGTAAEAAVWMREDRGCVVPDHFAALAGLKVGDTFRVLPPEGPTTDPVEYRVAGVVRLQGWHWLTKFSGIRRRSARAGALVFANFPDVRRDFGLERINYVWADLEPGVDGEAIGRALLPIAERNLGARAPVNGQGTWAPYGITAGNSLRITTPTLIDRMIRARSDAVIWGMSQLPLVTLLISALAVVNTMVASVRARRWELGVVRAVGVTRSAVFRLVLAEALLVGLVACVLGVAGGALAGACGAKVSGMIGTWGGMAAGLELRWDKLLPGVGLTIALCVTAGLWPAVSAGRAELLGLLRAGRGA